MRRSRRRSSCYNNSAAAASRHHLPSELGTTLLLSSQQHGLRYVLSFSPLCRYILRPSGSTKNPFSSSASLDVNPFDDPFADQDSVNKTPQYLPELTATRAADLDRREQDLERRERELHHKAENIRKHGRNNWPPCKFPTHFLTSTLTCCSLPPRIP